MNVNGESKSIGAPALAPPKAASCRTLPARVLSVGEAWLPTGGQAFTNPRRLGGSRPKRLSSRVGPPASGGFRKVKVHLNMAMQSTTYGHAAGVAFGRLGSGCTGTEGLLAGVVSHAGTYIGGPATALRPAGWACRRPFGRRHAFPRRRVRHALDLQQEGPRRHAVAPRPFQP